jgi:hypothetical protein
LYGPSFAAGGSGACGGNGRGPGLRREEAALLAGVSVKLNLLTSWAATLDGAEPAIVTER